MSKWRNTLQNRTAKLATKSYIRFIFGSRVFKPLIASVLMSVNDRNSGWQFSQRFGEKMSIADVANGMNCEWR